MFSAGGAVLKITSWGARENESRYINEEANGV
jgi:hypothetical protein